ncbi:thioesterase family protein [Rugosimonospora acidiphila]|uniref:Thioesterase family protein n=1 Tax=Rugosimonospora acidiphila TaxID=556531 RepID=A0ABP9RQI7_9ACTN
MTDPGPFDGDGTARGGTASHLAQVRWSDPDTMGHVNHARYLSYFEDARMALLARSPTRVPGGPGHRGCIAARVAVDYLAQVTFRPDLMLRVDTVVTRIGTSSWSLRQDLYADGPDPVARCECVMVTYDYAAGRSRPMDDDERGFWAAL